jgi:hypothetical protein
MATCECSRFGAPILTYADVLARCGESTVDLRRTLEPVRALPNEWASLFRCRECGNLWCQEYPFSEHHGGGAPCIYRVESLDADHWAHSHRSLTPQLREQHGDAEVFGALHADSGPERCQYSGCSRLRMDYGVLCRRHHFEMVKGRAYSE